MEGWLALQSVLERHWKLEERKLELYERRTEAFERIARALEHSNEKRFHSV